MKGFLLLVTLVGGFLLTTSHALAAQFRATENVSVPSGETINDDVYAAGEAVTIDGTVNGDVIAAGGQVRINGTVAGDLIVAAGQVFVNGTVKDDIRVAGGDININGPVDGDLITAGGNVEVAKDATIGGMVQAFAGQLVIAGKTNRVEGYVGTLTVQNSATINGDLIYTSDEDATIQDGSNISGAVTHKPAPAKPDWKKAKTQTTIYSIIITTILAYLLAWLLPNMTTRLAEQYRGEFLPNLLWGFLFLIVTPILAIVLFITIIGAPIGLAVLLLYPIVIGFGKLVTALSVGSWLENVWRKKPIRQPSILAALLGAVVLSLVGLVPILGWLVVFIAFLAGLGGLAKFKWDLLTDLRAKKQI